MREKQKQEELRRELQKVKLRRLVSGHSDSDYDTVYYCVNVYVHVCVHTCTYGFVTVCEGIVLNTS